MLQVNIIGIGPGNPDLLTAQAKAAIAASTVLIGDQRMLAAFATDSKKSYETISIVKILTIIATLDPVQDVVGILVSGDVGFFSLTKTLAEKLTTCQVRKYCGISSLVYFAQSIGMSWEDARIISMHGRNNNIVATVFQNAKVFSLTGGDNSAQALCAQLCEHGLSEVLVYVGEKLSYPDEKITCGTAEELSKLTFPSLAVMMILNAKPVALHQAVPGLADEMFMRATVPMTKQEIRAISLSKLQPRSGDTIYDIGAGTGSVSIELALQATDGQVWAFERNPEAVALLGKNQTKFGVTNLTIVAGEAAEAIKTAPTPDCVFIGGSGGNLHAMLNTIYGKNPQARIVMNAITIETIAEIATYYQGQSAYTLEIVNVFTARSKKLGAYNMMMAQNPIYIMTATKKEE
ncbi:MAG: precorrin-6y C5,15-methyltransferase (decarboxylating) subunit CbiE [Acidaminococcaceae bacterium]